MGRESTEEDMVEIEMLGEKEARRRRRMGRRTRRVHNVEPQAELALASTAGKPGQIIFIFLFLHFHYVEQQATLKSMIMFTQLIALDLATALS